MSEKQRFAFVGLRHPHVFDMYRRCLEHASVEVVGCCEEDPTTRAALAESGEVDVSHDDFTTLLTDRPCDVVAVGDSYGLRARRILQALESGKHVISDKPLCTSQVELDEIMSVADRQQRIVGCMLDMRDLAIYVSMREALRAGRIGTVHAISFEGQHPLLFGRRPDWYFVPGMHGGVFNDIAIHAVDIVPWMTGLEIRSITAARAWNATVPQYPHFQQCGQLMLTLENGAGVLGDVSYLIPDSFSYTFSSYWRFLIWGSQGVLEGGVNSDALALFREGAEEVEQIPLSAAVPGGYLDSFLREISGQREGLYLSSQDVRRASRTALQIQEAADQQQSYVATHK